MPKISARDVLPGNFISTSRTDQIRYTVPVTRVVTIGDRTTIHRQAPHWTQAEKHTFQADHPIELLA